MATVLNIVQAAMYLSTNDREFFKVDNSGQRQQVALDIYKAVVDEYRINLPFYQEKKLDTSADLIGVGAYGVVFVDYILGNTRIRLERKDFSLYKYYTSVIGLKAVPQWWYYDHINDTIEVYPIASDPNNSFFVGIKGALTPVNIQSDLPTNFTLTMQRFVKYEVARQMCDEYNIEWTPQKEDTRIRLLDNLITYAEFNVDHIPLPSIGGEKDLPVPWLARIGGLGNQ